jgi:secreted trypsin-like serine protease
MLYRRGEGHGTVSGVSDASPKLSTRRRAARGLWAAGVVAFALLGFAAVQTGTANAIANGEPVREGQYRFSVKLTMTGIPTADGGRRNSACSGALITPIWIITAGHCFRDANGVRVERPVADLTTATIGRANLSTTTGPYRGVVRTVVAVRQSPTNDVAVAKLNAPVLTIRPLALPTAPAAAGDVLRLTGYGATSSVNPQPSGILMTGQVTVVGMDETRIGVVGRAPAPDTSACPFDSGAPYFSEAGTRPVLVSVENTGPDCPHAQVEVTARIDTIVPWIEEAVGHESPTP